MKHLIPILIFVFGIAGELTAQDTQYYCKDGYEHFFSSAPMEGSIALMMVGSIMGM